jgi:hypothetical protein
VLIIKRRRLRLYGAVLFYGIGARFTIRRSVSRLEEIIALSRIVAKADPNSRCPQGNFLILIPDEIQVVSW